MSFISKIISDKKAVITVFIIFSLSIIALCVLCFNFYTKLDRLTNPNYFPPEIETLFLSEINISEFEVLSTEHIKDAIKDVSEEKIVFSDKDGNQIADYESMPNSLKLLIDEFIDGIISRKNYKVTREKLITDLMFSVNEYYVFFMFSSSSIRYGYTYYLDGAIRKGLVYDFSSKLKMVNHYMNQDEIGVQIFFERRIYHMTNDGDMIVKSSLSAPRKKTYIKPSNEKISVEDYNLFRSDYLEGIVPKGFKLTIENIQKYLDKNK